MRRRETYIFATDLNRRTGRGIRRAILLLLLALVLLAIIGNAIMSRQVRMERIRISVPELPVELEEYSILHFSDLHGLSLGQNQQMIVSAVGSQASSIAVFTGDMLGLDGDAEPLLALVSQLSATMPKLLILGDEDLSYLDATPHGNTTAYADWAVHVMDAGVTILDAPYLVARGTGGRARIWFIPEELYSLNLDALESTYQSQLSSLNAKGALTAQEEARRRVAEYQVDRVARIRQSVSEMRDSDVQIVLSHTPLTADYLTTVTNWRDRSDTFSLRRCALVLAGHTCAGGWRLPLLGPVWTEEDGFFPGDEGLTGLRWLGGTPQYISPGLGMHHQVSWMSFRLFNTPTVSRIVLTSKAQ